MKEDNTLENASTEHLANVRARNQRDMRRVIFAVCLVAALGLTVRGISYLASRPPRIEPPLREIPGYYKEDEVMASITNGISMTTLIAKYGPPGYSTHDVLGYTYHSWSAPTPRRYHRYEWAFSGFSVKETNGIIFWKGTSHMNMH